MSQPSLSATPGFRDLIAELRRRKSLTQHQLASELRVSFVTINRWETGKTVPDDAGLHRLAEFSRAQGSELADLAERFEQSSFAVPAKTRRARRKQASDDTDTSVVLDVKSMETMLWKAACSIRGEKDAPKFKDYILPLLFIKRLSDVFEDEMTSLAATYGNETVAREVLETDHSLVRFYLPPYATWPVLSGRQTFDWPSDDDKPKTLGEALTTATRAIARENKTLQGVIDIVDFNETRNGEREISDSALSGIIELFSQPRYRLGLHNVEPDFLGRAYEYLLRKFAENQGQSAGEFFTPKEVGWLIAYLVNPQQGEEVYDPTCGSAGLLVKCELALIEQEKAAGREVRKPLKLYGQELTGSSYAIGRMNMVLHDMEGEIVRGNTMTNPKFLDGTSLKQFDIVVANPMWNQNNFSTKDVYEADTFDRFGGGIPPESSADWGWLQHIAASLKPNGRAAVVLDTGAVSRGSGNQGENKEKTIRRWFVEQNLIDAVVLLPDNLFYNTSAAGVIVVLRRGRAKDEPIVLINASGEFVKGRPKNHLTDPFARRILRAYRNVEHVNVLAKRVSGAELVSKDFALSPSVFVSGTSEEASRPIAVVLQEYATLRTQEFELGADLLPVLSATGVGRSDTWPEVPLGQIAKIGNGSTPRRDEPRYWEGGTFPWLTSGKVHDGIIRSADEFVTDAARNECHLPVVPASSIVVAITGQGKTLGNAALVTFETCVNQHLAYITIESDKLLPEFLLAFLQSRYDELRAAGQSGGTTKGALTCGYLKTLTVPVPVLSAQRAVVATFKVLFETARVTQAKLRALEELLASTLRAVMSGKTIPDHSTAQPPGTDSATVPESVAVLDHP